MSSEAQNSRSYSFRRPDTYVLEIKGNLTLYPEKTNLDLVARTLVSNQEIKRVIVHQADPNLRISSDGLGKIIFLSKNFNGQKRVDDIETQVAFVGLKGLLAETYSNPAMKALFPQRIYDTLDEAYNSFKD